MKPFHKIVKMYHTGSETKNTVMKVLSRMQNLCTSEILVTKKVADNFSQRQLSLT